MPGRGTQQARLTEVHKPLPYFHRLQVQTHEVHYLERRPSQPEILMNFPSALKPDPTDGMQVAAISTDPDAI